MRMRLNEMPPAILVCAAALSVAADVEAVQRVGQKAVRSDGSCAHAAAVLRERLEPIVEAAIDGRPARAAPAAERAAAYWKVHRAELGAAEDADSLLSAMRADAVAGRVAAAARSAVLLADSSFAWCPVLRATADHLARIDLVGETAWLRSQGQSIGWPARSSESVDVLAVALNSKGRSDLAEKLRAAAAAAEQIAVAAKPAPENARQATRLLDLVDVLEKVLR